jgi:hypothetical protein
MVVKPKIDLNKIIKKLDCETYSTTGKNKDEGMNCFSMIIKYLQLTCKSIPYVDREYFLSLNLRWHENSEKAVNDVKRLLAPCVDKIKLSEILPGDILLLEDNEGQVFPAIYVSNGKAFTMTPCGTGRVRLAQYKINEIFRGK